MKDTIYYHLGSVLRRYTGLPCVTNEQYHAIVQSKSITIKAKSWLEYCNEYMADEILELTKKYDVCVMDAKEWS